jgi:hypothetical protein
LTISLPTKIAPTVAQVFDFMRKRGLALTDLIEIGGEDLESRDLKKREKARSVEKCWSLMARLSVSYANLEQATTEHPTQSASRRRGEGVFSEAIENKEISASDPLEVKSLKNNNKTDDHSVELAPPVTPKSGRWKHKRRLAPNPEGAAP